MGIGVKCDAAKRGGIRLGCFHLRVGERLGMCSGCAFFHDLSTENGTSHFIVRKTSTDALIFSIASNMGPRRVRASLGKARLSFSVPTSTSLERFIMMGPSRVGTPIAINRIIGRGLRTLPRRSVVVVTRPGFAARTRHLTRTRQAGSGLAIQIIAPRSVCGRFSDNAPSTATCHHFVGVFCSQRASRTSTPGCLLLFNSNSFSGHGLAST